MLYIFRKSITVQNLMTIN